MPNESYEALCDIYWLNSMLCIFDTYFYLALSLLQIRDSQSVRRTFPVQRNCIRLNENN